MDLFPVAVEVALITYQINVQHVLTIIATIKQLVNVIRVLRLTTSIV